MRNARKTSWISTIVVIAVAVIAYLAYRYGYVLSDNYKYYTYYEDVHGLQSSSPVLISGVRVGTVTDVELGKKNRVKVTLSVHQDNKIPEGTVALLASNGILGDKYIMLQPGTGKEYIAHKGIIRGKYDTTVMEMNDQIDPVIESAKYILSTAQSGFDNFNKKVDSGLVDKTRANVKSIEKDMSHYRKQVEQIHVSADKVISTLKKLNSKTGEIVAQKEEINTSLENTKNSTAELAASPIKEGVADIHEGAQKANTEVADLTGPGTTADQLTKDKKPYNEATEMLKDVNAEMQDMKENPQGISILGK